MDCVICENVIEPNANGWDKGNNAWPVKQGKCCDTCDENVVIPRRMLDMGYHSYEVSRSDENNKG